MEVLDLSPRPGGAAEKANEAALDAGLEPPDLEPRSGEVMPRRGLARKADGAPTKKTQRKQDRKAAPLRLSGDVHWHGGLQRLHWQHTPSGCRRFHLFFISVAPTSAYPPHPGPLVNRILPLAASTSLCAAALLAIPTAAPMAMAHVGHGDEFQQQGDARQVKRNAESDGLLGVATARPEQGPDGLSVPSTALVDANGKPLLFVQTEKTYDPVVVQTGANQGDSVVVTEGIDPTDDIVISGALSLYAESMKTQQPEPTAASDKPAEAPGSPAAARSTALPVPALAAGAAVLLAGGGIWLSRRRKTDA